jgi:hypothetical protein
MRALVFFVIAATVTVQGLTGGILAGLLGLRRASNQGYLILGANPMARYLARALREGGEPVILVDSSEDACMHAKDEGFDIIYGNGLELRTLMRGQADSRRACIAVTPNESVNFLFAKKVLEHCRGVPVFVGLETESSGITAKMVEELPAELLFGGERPLFMWTNWLAGKSLVEERWELGFPEGLVDFSKAPSNAILPLVGYRGDRVFPIHRREKLQKHDKIVVLVRQDQRKSAYEWLRDMGFVPVDTVREE